ncbi:conserved Plasmodium protein, unknown function [Plasmodium gallinaceum]|uniref:Uncharacterized protein n=1 Tax=Plasmodium gallinaceum TaxID=5849 RepID=A0A1J1GP94_PLAGA|nr:conserved Plasmodium protein, unknown function [Plasmodium gallinaceum]CRG94313.1 conserved Plasmodium protein, unknown function [Plasmodium gallinaceum]
MFVFILKNTKLPYVSNVLSQIKYFHLKSNFISVNFNHGYNKKENRLNKKRKIHLLFDESLNIQDKLILFKNLPKCKGENFEEICAKKVYKYLLSEYKKCFNFMSFCEIIETIKIFIEIDKKFNYDFYISMKNVDKKVMNKLNELDFREKDVSFHKREIIGKICNRMIKYVHEISGNELIHFIIYFYRWNKNDKNLVLFYNFYFNHVFNNLFLFNHEIYKILFILNTYLINSNSNDIFNKCSNGKSKLKFCYFKEFKNKENYYIKIKEEEIYKKYLHKFYEDIDKIENEKVLNILKLYVDNSFFNINIDLKIFDNLHKNLSSKNLDYLIKLLKICCIMIKKHNYENGIINSTVKQIILSIYQFLRENKLKKKVLCDIKYSILLNSVNNKKILKKIIDHNFVLFYEYLLKILSNIKFVSVHSLSISLISLKNIYFTLLKNKYSIDNMLFYSTMKYSLYLSNIFLEKCIEMENKNAMYVLSNNNIGSDTTLENMKEIKIIKKNEYFFYKIENYIDFNFKLKENDLLFIKILSNSFVKINHVYNSYDFYLLFNNISCILYYFLVNRNTITKFNDTYIYILNDLSYIYKNIRSQCRNDKFISSYIKELICNNILKVSNLYIKNLYKENNFLKDQYICSLIFLNNLFFDKIALFDSIYNIWCHVYKAYNYFKTNRLINEDIISLLLLTCSKFQFFIENNTNNRYCRKELVTLKYNIIDDLTKNYLNTYEYISLDNFSKIFISLSNSKYMYEVNENLLIKSLHNEIIKIKKLKKGSCVYNNITYDNNTNKKLEDIFIKNIKHELFLNFTKIIECLIKLNIFLHLKKKDTYLNMYKKTFCYIHLKENILKKLLYIANNLYIYQIYSYTCEILKKSIGKNFSYNFKNNVENKIFEDVIRYISEDDYIEISNTIFILFYDYLENLYDVKYKNGLIFPLKDNAHFVKIKRDNKRISVLNNNQIIKSDNSEICIYDNGNNIYTKNEEIINNYNEIDISSNYSENSVDNILKKGGNIIYDIINLLGFLKIDKNKLILFQVYMYLYDIKKFKKTNSCSMFHMEVFSILKDMSSTHLRNFKIKNEEPSFLYTIDIVLFKIK